MTRPKVLGIVAAAMLAASAWSNGGVNVDAKPYEYQGEKFEVSEPTDGRMQVSGKGLTATISIHAPTGRYREDVLGWGSDHPTLERAWNAACSRIIDRAARPSEDGLLKALDELYDNLK